MKKGLSLLLVLVLLASMLACPAFAASDGELQEIEARKDALQQQIDEVKNNEKKVLERKYLMDQRNAVLQEEIDAVNANIDEVQTRIAENEAQEKERYEDFCAQVRQEEERGRTSYWSVLFKATSFADLLSRAEFINEVAEHEKTVMNELWTLREQLAADKAALEQDKAELDAVQSELEEQIQAANDMLKEYASTKEGLQDMYDEEEAAAAEMEAEMRRKSSNSSSDSSSSSGSGSSSSYSGGSSGGYIWPTNDTRLITSPIGGRASPGGIGSTNHQGVDIGASYGSAILAAKSGVVIQSGWYGGYGYCVTIQHGSSGNYTRYGHMCSIAVSEGQSVSQGQVIGYCGSTGNSTGPHIHFEIHENYELKNPLDYLGGYVPYW